MTKFYVYFIGLLLVLSSCSTTEKAAPPPVDIPEINLTEVDYYTQQEVDKKPSPVDFSIARKVGYPAEARKKNIQGEVIVEVLITKEGNAYITNIKKSAHPILDNGVITIIKETTFEPGILKDKPVNVLTTFPVKFNLQRN